MPFSSALTPQADARPPLDWASLNPFADLQVRTGIRVGLAAVLALWIAQTLRLEHPNWSVLAVLVLSNAHYVGAIATKALMRSIGTVAGALLGVWVVGDFANTPLVFVILVFVVVGISAYKSGQLGSAAWPYAYYLMGMTLVSVATYAIADPGDVWRIALYRALETLVGVASATVVYSLLWPRYSREEFAILAGETVITVRSLLGAEARAYVGEAVDSDRLLDLRLVFSRQILGLRALLATGGRGSIYFRARLGNFQRFVVAMTHLFQALLELQRRRADEDEILNLVRPETDRFVASLDADLGVLSDVASANRGLAPDELNAAFAALEARVKELRQEGAFRRASVAAGEAFFGHYAALRLLRDELTLVHQLVGELPRLRLPVTHPHKRRSILPTVDWLWAREGVKAGIATCLSFLLLEWIHPPGATAIPLGAWLFSVFGRQTIRSGGMGDLRIFQRMFLTILTGIPIVALLWLIMPVLSNYWAMNVLLFVVCYVFGFVTARGAVFGYSMSIMLLAISTLVAINPQEPVAFGTLRDSFIGLMVGVVIGGVVSRVIWPVLPQKLLQGNLIQFFENLRALLGDHEDHEYVLTDTVLLPLEALRAVQGMILPRCPAGERDDLANFIRLSHPLGMEITGLRGGKSRRIAPAAESLLREPMASLEVKFDAFLEKLALCFRRSSAEIDFPDPGPEIVALDTLVTKVRDEGIVANEDIDSLANMLELVDRYHSITERLLSCSGQLAKLSLHRYLGDVAL